MIKNILGTYRYNIKIKIFLFFFIIWHFFINSTCKGRCIENDNGGNKTITLLNYIRLVKLNLIN